MIVIGHRGASGYRPEHTLAAYELAAHVQGIGPNKRLIVPRDVDNRRGLPAGADDLPAELRQFCQLEADGLSTDNPDLAVAIREKLSGDQSTALGPSRAAP